MLYLFKGLDSLPFALEPVSYTEMIRPSKTYSRIYMHIKLNES